MCIYDVIKLFFLYILMEWYPVNDYIDSIKGRIKMKTLAIAIMLLLAVVSHQQMKVEKPGTVCTKPAQKPSPSLG